MKGTLTVRELIEELEGVDGNLPVIVYADYEDMEHPLIPLGGRVVSVETEENPFKYGGNRVAVIHI